MFESVLDFRHCEGERRKICACRTSANLDSPHAHVAYLVIDSGGRGRLLQMTEDPTASI
jgi:hypothetical protein